MVITLWYLLILFFIGLAVGSFINAFEYRLHHKINFISKRSMCTHCKHELGVRDLIPLLSFFMLKGKCRYCETNVSWQYPIIEFLTGCLFLGAAVYSYSSLDILSINSFFLMYLEALIYGLLFSFFLFIALYDVKHGIIPNSVIIPAFFLSLLFNLIVAVVIHISPDIQKSYFIINTDIAWNILACIAGTLFIGLIIFFTKGKGMGGGDLKLVAVMGLLLGIQRLIIALYIAVILGSIGGILWGMYKGKIRGLQIPFGLFLSLGAILSFLYGYILWNYLFGGLMPLLI